MPLWADGALHSSRARRVIRSNTGPRVARRGRHRLQHVDGGSLVLSARSLKCTVALNADEFAALGDPVTLRVLLHMLVPDFGTLTADVASKSVRKAQAQIAEHGVDGVAVIVQASSYPGTRSSRRAWSACRSGGGGRRPRAATPIKGAYRGRPPPRPSTPARPDTRPQPRPRPSRPMSWRQPPRVQGSLMGLGAIVNGTAGPTSERRGRSTVPLHDAIRPARNHRGTDCRSPPRCRNGARPEACQPAEYSTEPPTDRSVQATNASRHNACRRRNEDGLTTLTTDPAPASS